jgi:transcriptional regulator with XRE-family HTH domain
MLDHRTDIEVNQIIGRNIRHYRTQLNLSQTDIGRITGVTYQQVQKWEVGANRISASRLYKLSKFFCIPMEHLCR